MTLRIVVADDHPMYRFGLTAVLTRPEASRWSPASVTGRTLAAVAEHAPDLVLTDLSMPDLDGVDGHAAAVGGIGRSCRSSR